MQRRKTKTTVKPSGARSRNGNSSNSIEYVILPGRCMFGRQYSKSGRLSGRMRHSYPGALCRIQWWETDSVQNIAWYPYAASHVSLSALSCFWQTAVRYPTSRFLILSRPEWLTSWKVLSRLMEEGVENDANDELGQGIEVGHSSCTVYMSGSFQLKRWEGVHSSWRHHFQRSFARFSSPFPNADLPLYGARLHSLYLFIQIV